MCAFDSPGCVFSPRFLLPLLGDYDGCVLPGMKFSVDLCPCPAHLLCFSRLPAGIGPWDKGMDESKKGLGSRSLSFTVGGIREHREAPVVGMRVQLLDLVEQKSRHRSTGTHLIALAEAGPELAGAV